MISYLIATNKDPEILKGTFESIEALSPHDYEIVICTPHLRPSWMTDPKIKVIIDEINDGSTYAMNLGSTHCSGEWIVIGTDEHKIVYNVNHFLEVVNSPQVQSLDYQVFNMGNLWIDNLNKQIVSYPPIDISNIPDNIRGYQYPVIMFPAISRKTVNTKFGGYVFNPHLIHHFVDHWLGIYVSINSPSHNFSLTGNNPVWNQFISTTPNPKWDNHDANIFCSLASKIIQNKQSVNYISNPYGI